MKSISNLIVIVLNSIQGGNKKIVLKVIFNEILAA